MKNNYNMEEAISFYENDFIQEVSPEWEMQLQKKLTRAPKSFSLKFMPLLCVLVVNLFLTIFSIHKHHTNLSIQEKELAYKTIRNQFLVNPS